jgi:hypothetical protein
LVLPPENDTHRLGEVVETSTTGFVAQCYELYGAPPLGALVKAGGPYPAYGIVHQVSTQGIDPSRRPMTRGVDEATEEEVYRSNPQLSHLLRTDFQAVIVGHSAEGDPDKYGTFRLRYYLPPVPPPIYAFVHACGVEEVRLFTANPAFLRPLATSSIPALEEVVAACLRYVASAQEDPEGFLTVVGKQLAGFFPGDFRRVETILQRAAP